MAPKRGIVLERWSNGLSVMLEKIFGCSIIIKLRSTLLMEANFNATIKIIYGLRMLNNVRKYKLMPEEVFSERNRLVADDGTLSKVIFYDNNVNETTLLVCYWLTGGKPTVCGLFPKEMGSSQLSRPWRPCSLHFHNFKFSKDTLHELDQPKE